jgi:hypothetical protein
MGGVLLQITDRIITGWFQHWTRASYRCLYAAAWQLLSCMLCAVSGSSNNQELRAALGNILRSITSQAARTLTPAGRDRAYAADGTGACTGGHSTSAHGQHQLGGRSV